MRLLNIEINGFKSFSQKTVLDFVSPVVCIVGPNGSGKSNVVEALRFVLGEQSMKSMRGKAGSDLIFKGSKELPKGSRASVVIYFDNADRVFKIPNEMGENINLNFDVVSISREVYPDGLNKYILNGSEVRLKDINNLLASVNVGASGHHIISQGEADRILNASSKDRREMIEDALGLKIYQYKIKESERKLERTENNMKEVSLLRRENAPHLNFLKKQVEKFEKAKELQLELSSLYKEYLKKESIYLEQEKHVLKVEKDKILHELNVITPKISDSGVENNVNSEKNRELRDFEHRLNEIRGLKGELDRKLGRIEGILESKEVKENKVKLSGRCPLCGSEIKETNIDNRAQAEVHNSEKELQELKDSQTRTISGIEKLKEEENKIYASINSLKQEIHKESEELRNKEREKYGLKVRYQELSSSLNLNAVKEESLLKEVELFENEIKEGSALIGYEVLSYKNFEISGSIDRNIQEENRRKIERIKIKLEDAGQGGGAEVMKEFEDMTTRDMFLAKELEDLAKSVESLENVIAGLKEKIDQDFKEGIKKINTEFQEFFSLMFGGGTGHLSVIVENKRGREKVESLESARFDLEEPEIVFENGIEINVSLPHKKVKELHALSGGERSLTSIALLFAMSQVNPPPFLVLDETDAALDESNSRKYGDMIEKLSEHSQLIVVTHNRETMSRAGILYGVTIGRDGASKLLSIKFDEATAIAK